ncbi:hypothetical protein ACYSNW_04820 [Enterococcus sp. LJL99]
MKFFGITIGEVATLIALITSVVSGLMFLLKAIVINPVVDKLGQSIDNLERSILQFSSQLDESKKDREGLHIRINKMDKRVTILEEHDKWEETHKKG